MTDAAAHDWLWRATVGLVAALVLAYRCALVHAAVVGVSRTRLRALAEDGDRRAALLVTLLAHRDVLQAALRFGFSAAAVLAAAAGWCVAHAAAPLGAPAWLVGLATLGLICFGAELLPRQVASLAPEATVLRAHRWVLVAYRLLGPLVRLGLADPEPPGRDEDEEDDPAESFRHLVDTTSLRPTQRRRITEILGFPDQNAGDVMVPRVDLVSVAAETPLTEVAAQIVASGFSRLPVYAETPDHIVGLVHARDVLARLPGEATAAEVMRRPLLVSETMRLDQLLREMRTEQRSLAVVVDEYGGTAGVVTVEDVIEEIVGEIHDETDVAPANVAPRAAGGWDVAARAELDEVVEVTGLVVPDELDAITAGGLVLDLAGDLPEAGEVVLGETAGQRHLWRVEEVDSTRLVRLSLVLQELAEEEVPVDRPEDLPPVVDERLVVSSTASLAAVAGRLDLDATAAGTALVSDLFVFEPTGARVGLQVRWQTILLEVVAAEPDGRVEVVAQALA